MSTVAAKLSAPAPANAPRLHWPLIWTIVVACLLAWGYHAHLERYITPQRGVGYWLGITGGSMMLLLLLYSVRKRYRWLNWLGGIPAWFEFHMILGILGPVLIMFHSNFHLGATNSNVALISMLLVAGSGVVGRYIYTRLHARLEGHEYTLEQLKMVGERLRLHTPGSFEQGGIVNHARNENGRIQGLPGSEAGGHSQAASFRRTGTGKDHRGWSHASRAHHFVGRVPASESAPGPWVRGRGRR